MHQNISSPRPEMRRQGGGPSGHTFGRTCLGCGGKCDGRELLRFVCSPQGEVLLDHTGRIPGRGAYVCCDASCLHRAMKVKVLAHALRYAVVVPTFEIVCREVRKMLCKRLGFYLGMSQKAGEIVSGYALIEKAFLQARVLYVVLAEDVAMRRAEEYRAWCIHYTVPYVTLFTKDELGRMLGKPSRSAVGLTASCFLEPLRTTLTSLERLQTTHGAPETQASFS